MAFHSGKDYFFLKNFQGDPIVQAWFQKKKNVLSLSRTFAEYNKRFFTLDLNELKFYYTKKNYYELKDMNFIDLKDITSVKKNSNPIAFPKGFPHCVIINTKGKDYYLFSETPADNFLYAFTCIFNKKTLKPLSEDEVTIPRREARPPGPLKKKGSLTAVNNENDPVKLLEFNKMNEESSKIKENSHQEMRHPSEDPAQGPQEKPSTPKNPSKGENFKPAKTLEITFNDDTTQMSINLELGGTSKNDSNLPSKPHSDRKKQQKPEIPPEKLKEPEFRPPEELKTKELAFVAKSNDQTFQTPTKKEEDLQEFSADKESGKKSLAHLPKAYKAKESEIKARSVQGGIGLRSGFAVAEVTIDSKNNNSSSYSKKKKTNIWDEEDEGNNDKSNDNSYKKNKIDNQKPKFFNQTHEETDEKPIQKTRFFGLNSYNNENNDKKEEIFEPKIDTFGKNKAPFAEKPIENQLKKPNPQIINKIEDIQKPPISKTDDWDVGSPQRPVLENLRQQNRPQNNADDWDVDPPPSTHEKPATGFSTSYQKESPPVFTVQKPAPDKKINYDDWDD